MRLAYFVIAALVSSGPAQLASAHECGQHSQSYGYYGCDHCGHPAYQVGPHSTNTGPPAWGNLTTVEGKVTEVVYLPGATPESGMVDIRIQTKAGASLVRLAPSGFLRQGGLRIQEGDSVSAKTFTVSGMRGEILVATEIQANGVNLPMRGRSGQPLW